MAKSYTHQNRMDFSKTFSHVAKLIIVQVLLALATSHKWHLKFLEEVYMDLPLGYESKREHLPHAGKLVCKLRKSIYSLKQASRYGT